MDYRNRRWFDRAIRFAFRLAGFVSHIRIWNDGLWAHADDGRLWVWRLHPLSWSYVIHDALHVADPVGPDCLDCAEHCGVGEVFDKETRVVTRVVERICHRIPGMEAGSLHSTHVGRDGLTPDQRAVIGAAGPAGFYHATGFSGTGFKTSPAVGLCMAELILDGEAKTVDISGYDPGRFERGEYLKGEHNYGNIWR